MLWNAKNGLVHFPETDMEYVRFGSGEKNLVILPGLGDGLRTMKGTAVPVAAMYRLFGSDFTVYVFSRKNLLPKMYSTRDMARDLMLAMKALSVEKADILGVSMGGMIAQHFAADYPQMLGKLILAVTCPGANDIMTEAIELWMDMAKRGDHMALMDSNVRRIYTDGYYQKTKRTIPLVAAMSKPKSYERFLIQAQACLTHDAYDRLPQITAPTLVIGGEQDRVVGSEPSRMLAERIPGARLHMYPDQGHGLYDEVKDFNQFVLDFLMK